MFLIALVEKLMPEIVGRRSVQYAADYLKKRYGISFSAGAITADYLANKKWYSYWDFGFVGYKMAFTLGKLTEIKSHFITYKSNENTSYLTTKLIKTVNVYVLKSNYNRIVSVEMVNVVKDSGEGWFFSMQAGARKHRKKLSWSHW